MKCSHKSIAQIDTIWWELYLTHIVSTVKATSSANFTPYI